MSIGQVTVTFKARKTTAGGGLTDVIINNSNTLTGTGATRTAAEQSIQSQIDSAINTAQGNVTDLQDANSAFNS